MTTNLDEYKILADMNNRTACPRCKGFGFVHSSVDRHDKPPTQRCKKCIDCSICNSSGVTIGVVECNRCNSKGFYHKSNAPIPHTLQEYARCFDCEECKDCLGLCVLDRKRIEELRKFAAARNNARLTNMGKIKSITPGMLLYPPMVPDTCPFVNGKLPVVPFIDPKNLHPHFMGILGLPISEKVLDVMIQMTAVPVQDSVGTINNSHQDKGSAPCPRCKGVGFTHDSSSKHNKKPNEKCKGCSSCKGCRGTGTVVGKQECKTCNTRGFLHLSTERPHDVPEHLRCFFCKDCTVCKGTGLETITDALMAPAIPVS